jgi:hypothetical protein
MNDIYKQMTDFLIGIGIRDIPHTHKTYLGHLIAVYRLMQDEGCTEEVCQAGMFHSVYGTERFQGFKLPLERRHEVRGLIGERAERLAYINCAMDRASLDRVLDHTVGPYKILDRLTGQDLVLSREDLDDLCRVHFYDFMEQVPRIREWDYRRPAYKRMAQWIGSKAMQTYERVFAEEQTAVLARPLTPNP